jgi:hypothetical protein
VRQDNTARQIDPEESEAVKEIDPIFWSKAYKTALEIDLCFFSQEILKLELGVHLLQWGELVKHHKRIAINAARDHSKSTFFSYAYPIWRAVTQPGCEVFICSATLEQAIEFLDIIIYGKRNLKAIGDIPALAHLMPTSLKRHSRERLKATDVRFTNGSRIKVFGYGKKIRGAHPDFLVLDDVLNDEDMWSETVRMKHIEYYKSAIVNMVPPHGQICNVGTPYHLVDLWGWLKENKQYVFRKYPGILPANDNQPERPLFPWRYSLAQLYAKKEEIGSVAFAREIECNPISDDMAMFPSYLFPPCYAKKLVLKPSIAEIAALGLTVYMGVDIARSATVGADNLVLFTIGVDGFGNHRILDIEQHKGMQFNDQLSRIKIVADLYKVDLIYIEANQMQQVWTDEMVRTTDIPVKGFVTTAQNKYPLDKGVPSLRILLENRKMIIPRGDEYSIEQTDIWMKECRQFAYYEGKLQGVGEHDDTVMAWWMATEASRGGGFNYSMGDPEVEKQLLEGKTVDVEQLVKGKKKDNGKTKKEEFDAEKEWMGEESEAEEDIDFTGEKSVRRPLMPTGMGGIM